MLSRFPTDGPAVDEDALDENLIGFPTRNIKRKDRDPDQIYRIQPTRTELEPITLQTLIEWQRNDPFIQSIVSVFESGVPANNTRLDRLKKIYNYVSEGGLLKEKNVRETW